MSMLRRLVNRIRALARRREFEREFRQELETHIEMAVEENIAAGLTPSEARRRALVRLGGESVTRQLHRESRGLPLVEMLWQDFRGSLRMLRSSAGASIFAILIVGLGIGACVTVFSVVYALLLRPLPFSDAEQLVWIENSLGPTQSHKTIQVAHLWDLQSQSHHLQDVAGYDAFKREGDYRFEGFGDSERLTGLRVTQKFFPLLGVEPAVGRGFTEEECQEDDPRVVMLSHGLWQRRFAADPGVAGSIVRINDEPVSVVGVLPASFDFARVFEPGGRVDLFWPLALNARTNRRGNVLFLIGRLQPTASVDQLREEVSGLAARAADEPARNDFVPRIVSLRNHVSGAYRPSLLLLACAVGLVMLIVCANLSNLLLSRDATRETEFALRSALGASRPRLIFQMLVESTVLASAGAALGLALAVAGTRLLAGLESLQIPLRDLVAVDGSAVTFTVVVALLTGVLCGLTPAFRLSSQPISQSLKEGGRASSQSRSHVWIRDALVVSEVALACVLLVGAGLLLRSFHSLLEVDLGFRPQSAVGMRIDPGSAYLPRDRRGSYFDEALRRVRAIPGVHSAGLIDTLPLGYNRQWNVGARGIEYPEGEKPLAYVHVISDGYLSAMGASLATGRDFLPLDDANHPLVILINQTLANLLWPGEDPVGRFVSLYGGDRVVLGVVRDMRHRALDQTSGAQIYLPIRQTRTNSAMHVVVRGDRRPGDIAAAVRSALRPLDPTLPLRDFQSLQDVVDRSLSPRRFVVTLLAGFAGFALILAALGIYSVISFSVRARRREIQLRIVLGANATHLKGRILAATLRRTALGLALGVVASVLLGQALQGLLFGVTPADPATFLTAPAILIAVAALAGYLPAREASRLNPIDALRTE